MRFSEVLDDSGETLRVEIVAVSWQARFIVSILVLLPKRLGREDEAKRTSTLASPSSQRGEKTPDYPVRN